MLLKAGLIVAAYLFGSIPFGFLLVKYLFAKGEDVRLIGSGGTGATNVSRRAGLLAGLLTYALDFGKGAGGVLLMLAVVDDGYAWAGAASTAAILGHVFPVFIGFRGGKGVATGAGAFFVLAPYSVLASLLVWILVVGLTRYSSLGSIAACMAIPLWTLLLYRWVWPNPYAGELVIIGIISCSIIVAKHHRNISRLLKGSENKIGKKVATQPLKRQAAHGAEH